MRVCMCVCVCMCYVCACVMCVHGSHLWLQMSDGEEHSKVSRINLVDLAGSERSSVALTCGDRLKVSELALQPTPIITSSR